MLCKTATEMTNQWNIVNAAFSDRIREYIKARTDLETHLAKVIKGVLHDKFLRLRFKSTANIKLVQHFLENSFLNGSFCN